MRHPTRRQAAGLIAAGALLPALPAAAQTTVLTRAVTEAPEIALTFDDGPHQTLTPQLLDILAAYEVRATFYLIGWRAAQMPDLVRRIAQEGHEIGNHTWSHPSLFGYGDGGLLNEIDRTNEAVRAATGHAPRNLRPPYGNIYPHQSRMLHQARGMSTVLWSVDPQDWQRPGSAVVASRIIERAHTGAVVLSHDIHGPTVRAMPAVIDGLRARGYGFVQVSELLGQGRWI